MPTLVGMATSTIGNEPFSRIVESRKTTSSPGRPLRGRERRLGRRDLGRAAGREVLDASQYVRPRARAGGRGLPVLVRLGRGRFHPGRKGRAEQRGRRIRG